VPALLIKGADGGLFVVLFALVGTVVQPKRLAGLFSAAPSVALANLLVEVAIKGDSDAARECLAMIIGGAAFVAYCLATRFSIRPLGPIPASAAALGAWAAVAGLGWALFLR
jgi:uncharacterized membrane protein (GlpM family)